MGKGMKGRRAEEVKKGKLEGRMEKKRKARREEEANR